MSENNKKDSSPLLKNERLPQGMRNEIGDMIKIYMAESLKPLVISITQLEQTIKDQRWSAGIAVPVICSVIAAAIAVTITLFQFRGVG